MYAEATARRFLLRYAGGGTRFPFDALTALKLELVASTRGGDADFADLF